MNIEDILEILPDKNQDRTTTSKKFKRDVFNFFDAEYFSRVNCMEIGCKNGFSTLILSYIFNHVYGINYDRTVEANEFLTKHGRTNYTLYARDVYKFGLPEVSSVDVFFVDAVHTYQAVLTDVENSLKVKSEGRKYFIFDDIGLYPDVATAVNEYIKNNILKVEKRIGYSPMDGGMVLMNDYEGIICSQV